MSPHVSVLGRAPPPTRPLARVLPRVPQVVSVPLTALVPQRAGVELPVSPGTPKRSRAPLQTELEDVTAGQGAKLVRRDELGNNCESCSSPG